MTHVARPLSLVSDLDTHVYMPKGSRPQREETIADPVRFSVLAFSVESAIPWKLRRDFRYVQDGASVVMQHNARQSSEHRMCVMSDAVKALATAGYQATINGGFEIIVTRIPLPSFADMTEEDNEVTAIDVVGPEAGTCCGAPSPALWKCGGL